MKRKSETSKKINILAALLTAALLSVSCWDGFGEMIDDAWSNTDAPAEVVMTDSALTATSMTLNWTEPTGGDFSHVLISWSGPATGSATLPKGTTQWVLTGCASGDEYTVSVKTVDVVGNVSDGAKFSITIPAAPISLYFLYTEEKLRSTLVGNTDFTGYCILMADISLNGTWTPLYSYYSGTMDGNGHVIRNVTISLTNTASFFGYIYPSTTIKNLGFEKVNIKGGGSSVTGGIAAYNEGIIVNCYVTGDIEGDNIVGGLVGSNSYHIANCYFKGNVTGVHMVGGLTGNHLSYIVLSKCHAEAVVKGTGSEGTGGLVGNVGNGVQSGRGPISDCYASGEVIASSSYSGGLVGRFMGIGATISNCHSSVKVTSTSTYAGGFIGYTNYGSIVKCSATGEVNGITYAGGFIGFASNTIVSNCYATGKVTGTGAAGGFIGQTANAPFTNCYATGSVSGTWQGGFMGYNQGGSTVTYCFYDRGTTGQSDTGKGIPKYTSEMILQGTYTSWDFTGETVNGTADIWSISPSINGGYPYLTGMVP